MIEKPTHPEDIKCAIYKCGVTLEDLSRLSCVKSVNIRKALRYPRFTGEQVIAQFLNIHPMELWPDRYDENGNPKHPHASANNLKPFTPKCKATLGDQS